MPRSLPPGDAGGQRQPRGCRKIRWCDLGEIGDFRSRKGERAGFVEHNTIHLGQAFDGIAGLDQDAVAEHGTGRHDLNRRHSQAEGAWTGDDQHGIAIISESRQPSPTSIQPMNVARATVCTSGG